MKGINAGWSQISITPDRPVYNVGQIYSRISQYVHDPITATALVLENDADQVIFLSMDMVSVPHAAIQMRVRANISKLEGIDPEKLTINVTHTHNSFAPDHSIWSVENRELLGEDIMPKLDIPDDILAGAEAEQFLVDRMTEVITCAWQERKPGAVSGASDYAAIAFNRRPVFQKDGKTESKMYGVTAQHSFVRYEGGSDHSAEMIYTWDTEGNLTGVMVCIPCPSQVFELHSFITADYWGYARNAIRERLGNVFVLPLCGTAGDQNPIDLTRISKTNKKTLVAWGAQAGEVFRNFDMAEECEGIADRIAEAVTRGYKKARNHIDPNPVLKHNVVELTLPIRKITREDYEEARAQLDELKSHFSPEHRMTGADQVAAFEPMGVIARWFLQNKSVTITFPIHSVRIGGAAVITNPFELFCEYGFRIKARAKSLQTIAVQLSNASYDYLPTQAAIDGGSYSSKPASTYCDAKGGDELVEASIKAIDALWD